MILAFYGRVSTQRQENEATIENQLMACRDWAEKEGHTIAYIYKDEDWSGTILARPALDQLRIDARKKMFEGTISYDPDRIARKYSYQELVTDELEELAVKAFFVTIPPAKDDGDRLLYGVKGLFAEYERTRIAERFRLGKLRKAREGKIMTSEAPYGLTYIPKQGNNPGYVVINEPEAEVIRMIFNWFDQGWSMRAVIRKLQELNIKPRKSSRGVWNTSTLVNILRNQAYMGTAHFNRSYATVPVNPLKHEKYKKIQKTSRKFKPVEEWIPIPVPAIIAPELFNRVRGQLRKNSAFGKRNKKYQYLLGSLIRCICGHSRVGEPSQGGKHLYYRCSDRIYSFPLPHKCFERGINAKIADDLVWKRLVEVVSSPKLIRTFADRFITKKTAPHIQSETSIDRLKRELSRLKEEEARYVKIYGSEVISLEQLEKAVSELKGKRVAVEQQIEELNKQAAESVVRLPSPEQIEAFCRKALEIFPGLVFEAKQKIVRRFVSRIIATQKLLEVYGCITFETLENVAFSSIGRDRSSTNPYLEFKFRFNIPNPRKERNIIQRDSLGRIIHSQAPSVTTVLEEYGED